MDCIFCKIASKEIPSTLLYEDEQIVAFNDNAPQAPTHVLLVPHQHIETINDLGKQDSALIGHMILTATQLAKDLSLAEDGYRLVWNCNRQGGQAVYHIHLHLLGGRNMHWPPG
ncbi:histidine triad nucleotide-binding protein [Photobacterium sp. OFAV2-7]|uniref:histidine triad nucleotide-binding protein n=1 Tax=Photobacterium sp. OFAV2-7 TaxID=2917748 RepID=UPI001EF6DED9|nr:histidine triad nucleotide-binding protein [Photobacterium sp. OFAV2-7]MCG7586931.1 histidine triad nucleotide-binding protein [Photobacterium sp. OFAV2-7]